MLRPNAIEITQINPMKEDMAGADERDDELPGGHGLASFKKQLESYQGTLTTSAQDGQLDVVCVHSGDRHRRFARFA